MKRKVFFIIAIVLLIMGVTYMLLPSSTLTTIKGIIQQVNLTGSGSVEDPWDISADDGISSVRAVLSEDGTTLTISGTGAMKDFNSSTREWNNVSTVIIEEGVTNIGNYAFYFCTNLNSVEIPEGITSIGDYAFWYCMNLSSLDIAEGVISVGSNAFYYCTNLSAITIPSTLTDVDLNQNLINLSSIEVAENNLSYSSIDGVLFNKEQDVLIKYPPAKEGESYIIPEGVTSIEDGAFRNSSKLTNIEIPEGVTTIGNYAFFVCTNLNSITIPASVISIGNYQPFGSCDSLSSIEVDDNNANFSSIDGVLFNKEQNVLIKYSPAKEGENYTIPDTVVSIKDYAFEGCSSLNSITIPEGVTSIGTYAFEGCSNLNGIIIPANVTSIENGTFKGCSNLSSIEIPSNVTSIGHYAFEGCSSLSSLVIPEGVTIIDSSTFKGCSNLSNIGIPTTVTIIRSSAFEECSSLNSVTIPEGVTSIEANTFKGCSSLSSVSIPVTVTSIGSSAFEGCSSLNSVTIPEGVTSIETNTFKGCSNLSSVSIPANVTSMGSSAFEGCSSLNSITIPEGVTSIASSTFKGCSSLSSVNIPVTVTSIGSSAFEGCSSLNSITVPANVTSIAISAFNECNSLSSIEVDANNAFYTSIDGVLFNKGLSELIKYPSAKEIESYLIPKRVTSINSSAFQECSNLSNIGIPASLVEIDLNMFNEFVNLKNIVVDGNNANYSSVEGVLFNKEQTELIRYPAVKEGESYIISASVTSIGYMAFDNCVNLKSIGVDAENVNYSSVDGVVFNKEQSKLIRYPVAKEGESYIIPASVTSIDNVAFKGCNNLINITIPDGITEVGSQAFAFCSSLKTVDIDADIEDEKWGMWVFVECANLEEIIIDSKVKNIGSNIIWNCNNLKRFVCADIDNEIDRIFLDIPKNLTIYALDGSKISDEAKANEISFVGLTQLELRVDNDVIDSTTIDMQVGDTKEISVYATTEENDVSLEVSQIFTTSLEDETIVTLDESRTITAIKPGQTKLIINNNNDYLANYPEALTINVEKFEPEYTVPTGLTAKYGQTLADVVLPEGFTWESELTTSVGNVGENTFTVTYTPKDTANYKTITGIKVKLTVTSISISEINLGDYLEVKDEETGVSYIENIGPNTTIGEIIYNLKSNGTVEVYDGEIK